APTGQKITEANHDAGWKWERFARTQQPEKDILELRDYHNHDHGYRHDGQENDGSRIDQSRNHIALQLDNLFDEGRKALQDQVENAACLAGFNHVRIELIEYFRVPGHRGCQG